jgi:hypothetical protein
MYLDAVRLDGDEAGSGLVSMVFLWYEVTRLLTSARWKTL